MNLLLTIRLALKNIYGNRLRSGLTILGVVIGIASVILLVGLVNGAVKSVSGNLMSMSADVIGADIYDANHYVKYEDMDELSEIDLISEVSPVVMIDATLSKGGQKMEMISLYATGNEYMDVMGYEVETGRKMSRIDVINHTKAVVIGKGIADKFWKNKEPCGDTLKINGDDYTIIGVIKDSGSTMGYNTDKTVIMPFTSAMYIGESTAISTIIFRAESQDVVDEAADNIESYFVNTIGIVNENDYYIETQKSMLESIGDSSRTLSLLLGGIAAISLLVGGVGVMNVMLVSVTERTREIGIRKSLGARRRDIMYQFLTESMVLSVVGGLIGITAGLLIGRLIDLVGISFEPSIGMVMLSVGVSMFVGLVFGVLPSYRAACLRPVEALRYE